MMVHEKGRWHRNNGVNYCSDTLYQFILYVPYFVKKKKRKNWRDKAKTDHKNQIVFTLYSNEDKCL